MTRFQSPRAGLWLTVMALLLLCSVAIAPLLTGHMPESADGAIHLYRLPVLDHAFKDGSLFPRYPVATVYGFGSPLFSYYAPFSLYPMHVFHLAGLSYLNAWLAGMALYVVLAAGGAYLLGRSWGGAAVGVVAAAGYIYSPYFIYDFLWRGTTSETAALALIPYVLWAIKTQADHPSRRTFLAVIASLALFIPMHNITTVHGGALIGLYAIFVTLTAKDRIRAGMRVFGALAIGVLLATFFWYPAIRETPNVKIDAITAALPDIDVTRNLVSAWSVLQPPRPADPSLQQPAFEIAFGWPQLLFGVLALATLRRQPQRIRRLLILGTLGIALLVFMLTPASAAIWRAVPFIGYSQYPTRLLGPASLLLAVLAGFGIDALVTRGLRLNGKMVRLGVPVFAIVVFALPLTVRTPVPEHNPQTVVDALDFERESGFVGSSSFGEYVPIWTADLPDSSALRERYAEETFIPRLRPPESVTIEDAVWRHTSGAFSASTDAEATLTFDWLYLPYFQASVDGEQVEVVPSTGEGRVQITAPAGTHRIEVWLAPSRTQAIAALVSATALMSTLGILGLWPLLRGHPAVAYVERFEIVRETRRALITAGIVGILALGLKAVFDRLPNPLRQDRFAAGYAAGVQTVADANFGREITLIGYDSPAAPVPGDLPAEFTLYWTPRGSEISQDYVTVFTLKTTEGLEVSRTDDDRPGGVETHHWRSGQYVMQQARIHVPVATPPGTYQVTVSLYNIESASSLELINADDNPIGIEFPLGTIEVSRGRPLSVAGSADAPILTPYDPPDADALWLFAELDGKSLLRLSGIPKTSVAGQSLDVEGLWTLKTRQPETSFSLEWRTQDGILVGTTPLDLDKPIPVSQWEVGEVWKLQHLVIVPAAADGRVQVALVSEGGESAAVGEVEVQAPERIFEPPAGISLLDVRWDNGLRLVGYVLTEVSVTLYWTNDEVVQTNLRRFAHVLNAEGAMLQVIDGVPVDWTRPIASWLPGEYVVDTLSLNVVRGQTLRIGFYDSVTYARIPRENTDVFDLIIP
ncbi:MAG: hypothetical protein IPK52_05650 [Chloroflexi bacterium]|nr:hypothetical protein [Chloroflexota bacterium]